MRPLLLTDTPCQSRSSSGERRARCEVAARHRDSRMARSPRARQSPGLDEFTTGDLGLEGFSWGLGLGGCVSLHVGLLSRGTAWSEAASGPRTLHRG